LKNMAHITHNIGFILRNAPPSESEMTSLLCSLWGDQTVISLPRVQEALPLGSSPLVFFSFQIRKHLITLTTT
jgi:hypothetical protein